MTVVAKLPVSRILAASLGNHSTAATPYSVTIPTGTGVRAGDVIVVWGDGNGTHVSNGMSAEDSVNAAPFPTLLEVRQGASSSHYAQAFLYQTPQDIADLATITFSPYAASTVNSFAVEIWRGLKGTVSVAAVGQSNAGATSQGAPALGSAPSAGDLVLTMDAASSGTLTAGSPFTTGSEVTTSQSTAIGYVLDADGASTYASTWSSTSMQTSATLTVALAAAEVYEVGRTVAASGTSSIGVNVATATQPGDAIIVIVSDGSTAVFPTGVADTQSNPYSHLADATGNSLCTYVYGSAKSKALAAGGSPDVVTVTMNSTSNAKNVLVLACGGLSTDLLDVAISSVGFNTGTASASSGPLARDSEVAVAVAAALNASSGITWPAGWTAQGANLHSGTGLYSSAASQGRLGTSPVTATATLNLPSQWSMLLLTFKAAHAGPGVTITTPSLDGGTVGTAYNGKVEADDGTGPYSYAVTSGTFPPGLTLGVSGSGGGSGASALARAGISASYHAGKAGDADGTGAPSLAEYDEAAGVLGSGMTFTKYFFSSVLPSSWDATANSVVKGLCDETPGYMPVLCWTAEMSSAAIQAFLRTIPADQQVGFCWQQEPELSGMTAAQFRDGWRSQATPVKSFGSPNLLMVHAAAGVTYASPSAPGWGGGFLPDPSLVDWLGVDIYQHEKGGKNYGVTTWPASGLATPGWSFANWLALAQPFGLPLAIMEYGVDFSLSDPAKRNARLQEDLAYILAAFNGGAASPFPLAAWMYWYRNMHLAGDLTRQWRFTDSDTIATWGTVIAAASTSGGGGSSSGAGGAVIGTPTTAGTYDFEVTATDSTGATATASFEIVVGAGGPSITTGTLPDGATGEDYDEFVLVDGGLNPLSFAITDGALPDGIGLDPDLGELSGNFTAAGSFTFDLTVTDSQGTPATATQTYTIDVSLSVEITTDTLPGGTAGSAYDATLGIDGGTSPYSVEVLSGSLPDGIVMDSSGVFSGFPARESRTAFVLQVTDSTGATAVKSLFIAVTGPAGRPVSPGFLTTITGSHRMTVRAKIITSFQTGTSPTGDEIAVIDGDVQLDGTAQVRGTLDLTTDGYGWNPRAGAHPLQPYGTEIYVERGVGVGGSAEWVGLGYFKLTDVEQTDAPGNPLRLTGSDRMQSVIDARLAASVQFAASDSVQTVFTELVGEVYPGAVFEFDWDAGSDLLGGAQVTQDDRYGFLYDVATSRGKIMFFDYRGILVVRSAPDPASPFWRVRGGADGVLVTADRTLSRDGMFNAIVATADGASSDSPPWAIAYDDDPASPTYWSGPFGKVPGFYSSPLLTTGDQCRTAAQAILARILGQPYTVDFTAVPNPAMQPFDPVLIDYGGHEAHDIQVISSLTIPLTPGEALTASTREQAGISIATSLAGVS